MHEPTHDFEIVSLTRLYKKAVALGMNDQACLLVVNVDDQFLAVYQGGSYFTIFPVSTSRLGLGEQINTFKTPRGFHEICERYGDELPIGAEFKSREFTGTILPPSQFRSNEGDKILSRILRLTGKVPGFNVDGTVDSYERMIYLHGTNQEQFVGVKPSSHGCIRMKNRDIISLFDQVKGIPVWCWIGTRAEII